MTLRTKLLALFMLLAVGPLLAIGVIGYALSLRAVVAQLEAQTQVISERGAEEIRRRVPVESDLSLLANNEETERLLELHTAGVATDSLRVHGARASVEHIPPKCGVAPASGSRISGRS